MKSGLLSCIYGKGLARNRELNLLKPKLVLAALLSFSHNNTRQISILRSSRLSFPASRSLPPASWVDPSNIK